MKLKIVVQRDGWIERYLDTEAYEPLPLLEKCVPEAKAKWMDEDDDENPGVYMTLGAHTSPVVEMPRYSTLSVMEVYEETVETIRLLQKWANDLVESEYEGEIPSQK